MTLVQVLQKSFRHISRYIHDNGTMTIITGANAPFYESLVVNLLPSIEKYEPNVHMYIWDLGFTEEQLKYLKEWFSKTNHKGGIITFPFDELPEHFNMSKHNYAFKSYCIYNTMIKNETDYYFWLDAGCGLRGKLKPERNLLMLYGFLCPFSSTNIEKLTFYSVVETFCNSICDYKKMNMLSAATIGLSTHNKDAVALITEWYIHSFQEKLLAPEGSGYNNHRYDQSLLSLCYYSRYKKVPLLARRLYHVLIHLNKH